MITGRSLGKKNVIRNAKEKKSIVLEAKKFGTSKTTNKHSISRRLLNTWINTCIYQHLFLIAGEVHFVLLNCHHKGIEEARKKNINAVGPLPPDTAFS